MKIFKRFCLKYQLNPDKIIIRSTILGVILLNIIVLLCLTNHLPLIWLIGITLVSFLVLFSLFYGLYRLIKKVDTQGIELKIGKLEEKTEGLINYSDYKKGRFKVLYFVLVMILVLAVLVSLTPAIWLLITSFKTTKELYQYPYELFPKIFDLQKIIDVWKAADFGKAFLNSVIVVLGAEVCSIVFNGLLGYVIGVVKPRGWKIAYGMIMLSYMIPTATSIIPLYNQINDLHLINSYIPLWLVFGANAFYFLMFKNYFESIPKSLFEAAKIDGCNNISVFFKVILPLSKPIIGVVAIFTMTAAWSDFLLPNLVLINPNMHTVMLKIFNLQQEMSTSATFTPDMLLMALLISMLPQIVFFIIFQKQITNSNANSGIKE